MHFYLDTRHEGKTFNAKRTMGLINEVMGSELMRDLKDCR